MKKLMNYAAIAVTMIAFLGASTLNAQEWTKDQMEVWKVIENGWAKWQEGDYDAAFANIHEKYLGWNIEDPYFLPQEYTEKIFKEIKHRVEMLAEAI